MFEKQVYNYAFLQMLFRVLINILFLPMGIARRSYTSKGSMLCKRCLITFFFLNSLPKVHRPTTVIILMREIKKKMIESQSIHYQNAYNHDIFTAEKHVVQNG